MEADPTHLEQSFAEDVAPAIKGQRVFVTGGNGFLGQYVVAAFRQAGAEVLAPRSSEVDLTDPHQIAQYLMTHRPDAIVHLAAACGGIGANVAEPARFLYENALMGLQLLEQARLAEVDRFVLISTTCAYPQNAPLPLREDTLWDGPPTGATGPYGMAKRLLHEAVATYEHQYGLRGSVLIPANLYGPGDHFDPANSHVVAAMIRRYTEAARDGAPHITNWGTGQPTREFLHVRDAARAIVRATAFQQGSLPVNLGTGVETSIKSLAEMIAHSAGYLGEIRWDTDKPDGQPRRFLDVSRAQDFGFQAEVALADGLAETIGWYLRSFH